VPASVKQKVVLAERRRGAAYRRRGFDVIEVDGSKSAIMLDAPQVVANMLRTVAPTSIMTMDIADKPPSLVVRPFEPGDEEGLVDVFNRSVRQIAPAKYSSEQVAAWLACAPTLDSLRENLGRRDAFVATMNQEIVGWIDLCADGHVDMLYCVPQAGRKGAADLLYAATLTRAKLLGISRLYSEASYFAESFFVRHGWKVDERQTIVRNGVAISSARMSVDLEQ
jgi:putative acetyltransferase